MHRKSKKPCKITWAAQLLLNKAMFTYKKEWEKNYADWNQLEKQQLSTGLVYYAPTASSLKWEDTYRKRLIKFM